MNHAPYELSLRSRVSGARPTYRFRTADGVVSKQSFRDAELLAIDALWERDLGQLLCVQSNYGVVGTVLSATAESVCMTESSARAAQLCEQNATANDAAASVSVRSGLTPLSDEYDTVVYAPKRYTPLSVGKQRIVNALLALGSGGRLYLTASKQSGLTRYEACLRDIAADVRRVSTRNDHHLLEAIRHRTASSLTYVTPRQLQPTVNGVELSLRSLPGLFAANALDDGTRLLLENTSIADGECVVDLCCGYGAFGTYAAKTADCTVWLSDDDRLATECANRSLHASNAEGTVITANCIGDSLPRDVDRILCNPPTHAGSGVLSELFAGIRSILASGGQLTLVYHRDLDLRQYLTKFDTIETPITGENHVVRSATT